MRDDLKQNIITAKFAGMTNELTVLCNEEDIQIQCANELLMEYKDGAVGKYLKEYCERWEVLEDEQDELFLSIESKKEKPKKSVSKNRPK
jgi:hypothetical protein